ncbi:uncharacterized protein LOC121857266 [Homarus americanus]|uniref:uncharacterized protein LOC121857266 n=1 Tax=Homarus americanus TaxID=6706 RepID=UPI001C4839E1|nr:uncharacterized protein LOC121857266 [Homarus americanus]
MADSSISCPTGKLFDPYGHQCRQMTQDDVCLPSCTHTCPFTCMKPNDLVFDPRNCSKFYLCLQDGPYQAQCPNSSPYFDGHACTSDAKSCCSASCPPHCPAADVIIPDGEDCHRYYVCLKAGKPSEATHFTCDNNQVFDYILGTCSPTAKCVTLCNHQNVTTTTTTTITPAPVCKDTMTCTKIGNFPKCSICDTRYFHCSQTTMNKLAQVWTCGFGLMFNPDPDSWQCVKSTDCHNHSTP